MDNVASATDTPSGENKESTNVSTDLQKEIEKLKAERKAANDEAAAYRIELKAKKEAEQIEAGKLTELTANLQKERDEILAKNAAFELELTTAKTKLTAIETARKTELLAKLPEAVRANYASVELPVLELISKDFANNPVNNSQGNLRGNGVTGSPAIYTPQVPFESGSEKSIGMINKILQGN